VIRRVEESVDLGDRHPLVRLAVLDDLVAGIHATFLQDAQVESGASVGREKGEHARFVHPDAGGGST
jgi:predicted oxidoreductase